MNKVLLFVAILSVSVYHVFGALKCYKCDDTKSCPLTDNAKYTVNCTSADARCYKTDYPDLDDKTNTHYEWGCAEPDGEKKGCEAKFGSDTNKKDNCEDCDSDLCNSAPVTTAAIFTTLSLIALAKFLY